MKERDRFLRLCLKGMQDRGVAQDDRYKDRFRRELKEIDAQGEHEYFLKLYEKFRSERLIFPYNEWNNLVDYVLYLAPNFDIEKPGTYVQGEFPDIDIDYLKPVRDKLKRVWAPNTFGQDKICEIGTYGTSGIKGSIIDMTRIHGMSKDEIQAITVKIKDKFSDDQGNTQELEWEDALDIYPEFKSYCERYPEIADAAYKLQGRHRSGGVHAGGLIISDQSIDGFVPLEVRMVNKDNPNGVICSAWTEGLNSQDLGPVGLIKFDLLVISNLMQIALACKLVKERHGLQSICALPGQWDWSDISYLNDPKALEMANRADLKCIFQFDSEGIRKMVKRGGVSSFNDLAAYSALYRPGPLNMGMDARYCKRKKGEEPYNIHPLMSPFLKKTYGVLVFQEQIMDMLRVVGGIPDMHTEKVRKAISKKKKEQFIKYKEMFVDNGKRNLSVNTDFVVDLWDQIESFAAYGFNASHAYAYSYISARLLYLKAHYPVEFYTAILMCEDDHEKMKDYKLDAKYHGVEVKPVNINKSKTNFSIFENDIYFGFSNIKGLGEKVGDRVTEHQPYENFRDFMERFGTDAAPIKAFTALGCFDEPHSRLKLRRFSEYYKEVLKKRSDRKKRFEESMDKKIEDLKRLLSEEVREDDPEFEKLCDFNEDAYALWQTKFDGIVRKQPYKYKGEERIREVTFVKLLQDVVAARDKSLRNFYEKEKDEDENPFTIDTFPEDKVKLKEEEEEILTDELVVDGVKTYPKAESLYYGFQWTHRLETCPEYTGATIDSFLKEVEEEGLQVGMIEVEIANVQKRTSKGEKATEFYSITLEDANGKRMRMNIWMDDFTRFQDLLKVGNCIKVRVRPPSGGFETLTFESVPKHKRRFLPAPEDDFRMILMKIPSNKAEVTETVLDDLKFDVNAIEGLEDL